MPSSHSERLSVWMGRNENRCTCSLAKAGATYALHAGFGPWQGPILPLTWPWETEAWKPTRDRVGDLAKAGALIAAEIDRLQRAAR